MNDAQQRLGRMIIALATLAGLAGFIANQVVFFQTHPTQAPEVYTLTAAILVIVVLIGLLGGMLVTHSTEVVQRRSALDRHSAPTTRRRSPYRTIALSASVVVALILAVVLPIIILHPAMSGTPTGPTSPGGGRHVPPPVVPTATATVTVSPTPTLTALPSPTAASTPTASPTPTVPPQASHRTSSVAPSRRAGVAWRDVR